MVWRKSWRPPWESESPGSKSWQGVAATMRMAPWRQISAGPPFFFFKLQRTFWGLWRLLINPKSHMQVVRPNPLLFFTFWLLHRVFILSSLVLTWQNSSDHRSLFRQQPQPTVAASPATQRQSDDHTSRGYLFLLLHLLCLLPSSCSASFFPFLFCFSPPIFPWSLRLKPLFF